MNKAPVSLIILTYNEEVNIRACLDSVKDLTDEIFIVDSFSTDRTLDIAREYTEKIFQNPWVHWAHQRNWALANLPLQHDWVFFLDADEQVTPALGRELGQRLEEASPRLAGLNVCFDFYFLNRHLRFAYESPPVLRIIRRGQARWEGEGAREYAWVDGEMDILQSRLRHWDRKPLDAWIAKQTGNARKEVERLRVQALAATPDDGKPMPRSDERPGRRWLRDRLYARLPRFWRSFGYFFYRYVARGGFLDGKAGFAFCFLHALWYPLLIDIMIFENSQK